MTKAKCCMCQQDKDIFGWVLMTQHKSLSLAYCPECYRDNEEDVQQIDYSKLDQYTNDLAFCFKS